MRTFLPARFEMNQGSPSPMRMLMICDPVELDTAIEPYPRLATVTDWMVSGISAPTAITYIPKRDVGMPSRSPNRVTTAAMIVEKRETHTKEAASVSGYHRACAESCSHGGHVMRSARLSGSTKPPATFIATACIPRSLRVPPRLALGARLNAMSVDENSIGDGCTGSASHKLAAPSAGEGVASTVTGTMPSPLSPKRTFCADSGWTEATPVREPVSYSAVDIVEVTNDD
mmetsp:Transcript_9547/g.22072  ORF Transcript_9547/g.22072 Transcript_9547/m.22072 type:complete len:230 (-) Transcript_9547:632-1321(-)